MPVITHESHGIRYETDADSGHVVSVTRLSDNKVWRYPYYDEDGTLWIDPSTFISRDSGPCFFCGTKTQRIDLDYQGYYCGKDDQAIKEDLERLDRSLDE